MTQRIENVAVIGGGPAGLMAAEVLSAAGLAVTVYDRMPTLGRKFLMAGRGGLNLTHSEALEPFLSRYGARRPCLAPLIEAFPPQVLIQPLKELVLGTHTRSLAPQDLWNRINFLCTVYNPLTGAYRFDYGIFFGIFFGAASLLLTGFFILRLWLERRRALRALRGRNEAAS